MTLIRSNERIRPHKHDDEGVTCKFCGLKFARYKAAGEILPLKAHEHRCPKKKEHVANFRMRSCGCNVCLILLAAEKELRK